MKELKGVDISEWNGGLDYTTLGKHIDFIILREGCRQRIDKLFLTHVNGCRAAKTDIKGVYHFIYALNNEQAKQEALSCINNVKKAGLPKTTWIWADFEYDSVTKAAQQGVTLGPAECRQFTETFCQTVKAAGYPTGIYTNLDYWVRMYGDAMLSRWPVWYAQYSKTKAKECLIWQSGSKVLPGSAGQALDYDTWYWDDETASSKEDLSGKTVDELAQEVIAGKYGVGEERKNRLGKYYDKVQARVNELLKAKTVIPTDALSDKRAAYVRQMQNWVGLKESDGSFRVVIDTYNRGLAAAVKKWGTRNVRMQYDWAWCECAVSGAAMAAGVADIVPIEISCPYAIEIAKTRGLWVENDAYRPTPGDLIYYDWQDSGAGDNQGLADHVGMVEKVEGNTMTIIEGNKNDSVSRRTINVNGLYIRGFIVPKF